MLKLCYTLLVKKSCILDSKKARVYSHPSAYHAFWGEFGLDLMFHMTISALTYSILLYARVVW